MFEFLESKLFALAHMLPLEGFVFFASIIEEILAPIPSSALMFFAGTVAAQTSYTLLGLLTLSILGAAGKTLGAYIVYVIVDRAEDVLLGTWGKYFSVRHEDVENLGQKLTGGVRDYLLLIGLRAAPIVPSVILSVGGGLLKVRMRLFLISTFIGTIFRDGLYLIAGYFGYGVLAHFIERANSIEDLVEIGFILICIIGVWYFFSKKRKNHAMETE